MSVGDPPSVIGDAHHDVSAITRQDHLNTPGPAVERRVHDGLASDPHDVLSVHEVQVVRSPSVQVISTRTSICKPWR